MPPQKNHFATLGVEIGAGEEEIKKAYRKLAKQWHPDKNKHPQAEDKFKEINASYEFLSSKDRREIHERELRNSSKSSPKHSQHSQSQPTTRTTSFDHNNSSNNNNSSSTNNNNTGKPSGSKKEGKPKRPSSAPKAKGTKKSNGASWSETFTKTFGQKKTQRTSPKEAKDSYYFSRSNNDDDVFSFTFESFDDKRPQHKKEDIEENLNSYFRSAKDFDDDFFWTVNFGAGFTQPRRTFSNSQQQHKNVSPESGNGMGLDDEYLFTPRPHRRSDNGVPDGKKVPCPWCGKLFPSSQLDQHEDKCGRFDLSEDEDGEGINSDLDDDDDFYTPSERIHSHLPSWQRLHEEHIEKVRRDKLRYKDRMASQGKRNSGFVLCPYCERSFNQNAAARHIPLCKEHLTTFGRPMNEKPSQSRTYKTENQSYQETGRSRANKYATGIPRPTMTNPFHKPTGFSGDGNMRKFPHPKPEVNMDDILGVNGKSFKGATHGSDNTTEANTPHKSSYAEIHRSRERQSPPKNSFTKHSSSIQTKFGEWKKLFKDFHK